MAQEAMISIHAEINEPYVEKVEDGEPRGVGIEYVRALFSEAGIPYTLNVLPWRRAVKAVRESDSNCLIFANRTPDRESDYRWVSPIILGQWVFWGKPNSGIVINDLRDLELYRLVSKIDSASTKAMENELGFSGIAAMTDSQAAKLLVYGRADIMLSGLFDGAVAAKEIGSEPFDILYRWKETSLDMACNKNTPTSLINQLNLANLRLGGLRTSLIMDRLLN
ncbi:MAG: transporter substrate-binding domain-containing protein [Alphaproteobacteria bacterium]|nr:transporter substrate-binding domain-containing protein [Alphaproteobacteria bacterium]